jgi:hypothetical protein
MKISRGFVVLGLILAVLIGVAIFGGATYYASKPQTPSTAHAGIASFLSGATDVTAGRASSASPPVSATTPPDTPLSDTTDWKVYEDPQYGFSFKYPSTLQIIVGAPMTDKAGAVKTINLVAEHSSNSSNSNSVVYGMGFTIRNKDQIDLLKLGTGNIESTQIIQLNGIQMTIYHSQIVVQANGYRADQESEEAIFQMRDYAFKLSSSAEPNFAPYFYTILSTVQ